jgi:hypothetical protein
MRAEPRTFPELRSRLKEILNVPMGRSRTWPAQGWAGEIYRYVSGFTLATAFLDGLFEHAAGHRIGIWREIAFFHSLVLPSLMRQTGSSTIAVR